MGVHFKFGHITQVDAAKGVAKVNFPDDDIVSGWLKMAVANTKDNKVSFPFDEKEHVGCLMDEEMANGIIICAVYDTANAPAGGNKDKYSVTFKDGTKIEYDRSAHKLTADVKGAVDIVATQDVNIKTNTNATVEAAATAKIKAPTVTIDGALTVTGAITAQQTITATGNIIAADFASGPITLLTHKHPTAAPGPPSVATP